MLTATQQAARAGKLTASRISVLMTGNVEGILDLWREMTGDPEFVPVDLSEVWPVRLGEVTEQLNLDWYELKNNMPVIRRGEVAVHPGCPWAACTLDGFVDDSAAGYPLETKHVGGREPIEVVIDRCQPQCQWQMFVTGATQCALSVIMGASPPIVEFIDRDDDYIAEMRKRGEQFMQHVKNRTPPVVLPAVPAPVDASRVYDFTGNNAWAASAADWLANKDAAKVAEDASKILKSLCPADAKKVSGHGVRITRARAAKDRTGALSLREDN